MTQLLFLVLATFYLQKLEDRLHTHFKFCAFFSQFMNSTIFSISFVIPIPPFPKSWFYAASLNHTSLDFSTTISALVPESVTVYTPHKKAKLVLNRPQTYVRERPIAPYYPIAIIYQKCQTVASFL